MVFDEGLKMKILQDKIDEWKLEAEAADRNNDLKKWAATRRAITLLEEIIEKRNLLLLGKNK